MCFVGRCSLSLSRFICCWFCHHPTASSPKGLTCQLSLQAQIHSHCFALFENSQDIAKFVENGGFQSWCDHPVRVCALGRVTLQPRCQICISIISFVGVFERLFFGRPQPHLKYPMHKNAIILSEWDSIVLFGELFGELMWVVWWVVWWVICYVILWRVRSHVAARKSQQDRPKAARFDTAEDDDDDDAAQDQQWAFFEYLRVAGPSPGCPWLCNVQRLQPSPSYNSNAVAADKFVIWTPWQYWELWDLDQALVCFVPPTVLFQGSPQIPWY